MAVQTNGKRQGSISIIIGAVVVLGTLGVSALFLTNSSARSEKSATLGYMTQQIANAALEETLVKVQNGTATWREEADAGRTVKVSWAPAATTLMYGTSNVKIAPVKVFARKIIERPENELRNQFYSLFSGVPNYAPAHDPLWENRVVGAGAQLGRLPDGVSVNQRKADRVARAWAGSISNDPLRNAMMRLPVLAVGRDHTDAELDQFLVVINGNTLSSASSAPRAQVAGDLGVAQTLANPADLVGPTAPQAPAQPNTNVAAPDAIGTADVALNSVTTQTGNAGCGNSTPANQAGQSLAGLANGAGQAPPLSRAQAAEFASANLERIDSQNPFIRLIARLSKRGQVFKNQPYMVTLEANVEATLGFGMTARRRATAYRVVGEYQFKEALNYVTGRLMKYWMAYNNLTLNDLHRMGFITNTVTPVPRFENVFPVTALAVPARTCQVWPFEVANCSTTY